MSRRRIAAEGEYPPRIHQRPEVDAVAFTLRPPRFVPKLAARVIFSERGVQPYKRVVQAGMPARRTFLFRRIMQRFFDTGPAVLGFQAHETRPPIGNVPPHFLMKPPRRLKALLPQGGALWTPPTYGEGA